MTPDWTFQVFFQMGHPITGLDQRWPTADDRISDLHTARRTAKADLLFWHGSRHHGAFARQFQLRFSRQPGDVERTETKHTDTPRDILHRLFAPVGKGERKLVANLLIGTTRDAQ